MKKKRYFRLRVFFCFFLFQSFANLYGQSAAQFDEIVSEIYNQDFKEVPAKIEKLKRISPQIANYLQIDYLWWKMISFNSAPNESGFLAALTALNNPDKNDACQNFDRLMFFTYQIRYENLKNKNLSKYFTLLKFHFFMENLEWSSLENPDSFVISMFKLMNELNVFMKVKFLNDNLFNTKNNIEKCNLSLLKIESMSNSEYKSFDVVKTYLLAKIYLEIENDNQQAYRKFEKLSSLFPDNTIFKKTVSDCKKQLQLSHTNLPYSLKILRN